MQLYTWNDEHEDEEKEELDEFLKHIQNAPVVNSSKWKY